MKPKAFILLFCFIVVFLDNEVKGSIVNGSFESHHWLNSPNGLPNHMPDDWYWRNSGATNGHIDFNSWSSNGNCSLYVFASTRSNHKSGDYLEFYQNVDMTGMTELLFDIHLRGGIYTKSYFAVDSQKLWICNQPGTFIDTTIDIKNLSGIHEVSFGVEVFQSYDARADGWTYFDNIRLVPEPATIVLFVLGSCALRKR